MAESEAQEFAEELNKFAAIFDQLCIDRHAEGAEEYGPLTFLGNDVVRMMLEELADIVNYCRMQGVKLLMLQTVLEQEMAGKLEIGEDEQSIQLGAQAFKGTKDVGWNK